MLNVFRRYLEDAYRVFVMYMSWDKGRYQECSIMEI